MTQEELERIRRVLIDEDVLEMLSNTYTCFEADEDHGGVSDDYIDGDTVQRARNLELAMNWLKPGYVGDAFPREWILTELSKLRAQWLAMREVLETLDFELDRQLYDEPHVKSCRNNDIDIAPDCEHHVIITEALRQKIGDAASLPDVPPPKTEGG